MTRPWNVKRTSAGPKRFNGITFHCYHVGILKYQWRSEDDARGGGRRSHRSSSYYAFRNGEYLTTRFRSLDNALKAAAS